MTSTRLKMVVVPTLYFRFGTLMHATLARLWGLAALTIGATLVQARGPQ